MKKTIGIFAHVDAGKTTFSEQILYHTNAIRKRGRVDHKEAYLDSHEIEKERGITIFSDIGIFEFKGSKYFLIDTPGHIDFSPEMERTISVLDYGIILISAADGVQGHTETVWKLLRKHNIPTFIFINKSDRADLDLEKIVEEVKRKLSSDIVFLKDDNLNNLNEEIVEFIAERDEELLEIYLEEGYKKDLWKSKIINLIKEEKLFVAAKGSALLDIGILEFINIFEESTKTNYIESTEFTGRVLKIKYDDKGNRLTFIKALSGAIKVKDEISYKVNGEEYLEKINEIRAYNGTKYEAKDKISAGDVYAVIGLSKAFSGMGIGIEDIKSYDMVPTLKAKVTFDKNINEKEVYKNFKILEEEEKTLNVLWNEKLKQLSVSIMGKIQLEVLKELVKERFNMDITFEDPEILYKETIRGKTEGYGHFEPLRHYAEVHLLIEEGKRGEGITFESKCHPDFLTTGQQNLVRTHIFEKEHKGILTGSPFTDAKITLLDGRAHIKHTEGGDFREASKRALRQGLDNAENILLEPYYSFKIEADMTLIGRILSDIQKMSGEFTEPVTYEDRVIINGRGPVSTLMNYPLEFQSFSRGRGSINLVFEGYDICHNTKEVVEKIGYDKNKDIEYTSSSIFCSKGEGFIVESSRVKEYMHCLKNN